MNRRDFFGVAGVALTGVNLISCASNSDAASDSNTVSENELDRHTGALTAFYEFRIAGPENQGLLNAVDSMSSTLASREGFLGLALKNVVGDSTMTKNYPDNLKGVLRSAQKDAFAAQKLPLFYSLFIRFSSVSAMKAAGIEDWFTSTIKPMLFVYKVEDGVPVKTPLALDYFEGFFKTVAAGDRNAIYESEEDILSFHRRQADTPDKKYVTVENHVTIRDEHTSEFNAKVVELLRIAQTTFRPDLTDDDYDEAIDPTGLGQEGRDDNNHYRKAVTTEILQNISATGGTRNYVMHGVWQSVMDHENSHIDTRFRQRSGPVGTYIIAGPVEPFYETRQLVNNA